MKKILALIGLDRAVTYTLVGRGWGLISGVVTLLLVARLLTQEEQGYYYTFASLLALQIFFELGMSYVIMQFASHEMAHLFWVNNDIVDGDANAKSRLHSLFVLTAKWYGVMAILIVTSILPIGWWFFSVYQAESSVGWQMPWMWLVIFSALNIFFVPMVALLEGCGRITEIAQLRLFQGIMGSVSAWTMLTTGGGLWALPVMSFSSVCLVLFWLGYANRNFFKNLMEQRKAGASISWKEEIWPFQWKIAISWLSGYFIFQLFTPVLFAYRGAIEAGQMGMSFSIANALMSIPMAWMNTKSPQFGALVAKRDYLRLNHLFNSTLIQSSFVIVVLGLLLCVANAFLHTENYAIALRFLDPVPFGLLISATVLNYVTYAQSSYLRAHKQEPFLAISLISAGLIAISTIALGKEYGAEGIMCGYLAVCAVVGFGFGSLIFLSKKQEWQRSSAA